LAHQPACHGPREYGVLFCKGDARPGRVGQARWRWQLADGSWKQVTVDGHTVVYCVPGRKNPRRQLCRTELAAELVGGVIAEELAGAAPGARKRRRYAFEPVES
jgi:hypothetical protein